MWGRTGIKRCKQAKEKLDLINEGFFSCKNTRPWANKQDKVGEFLQKT
jgi:hypothetical protein